MFRVHLKSKIHRATVTLYEGSCAIYRDLRDVVNLIENEQIHICNNYKGKRYMTYAIKGGRGLGMISLNGSAARCISVGDLTIIAAFAQVLGVSVAEHESDLCLSMARAGRLNCATRCPSSIHEDTY